MSENSGPPDEESAESPVIDRIPFVMVLVTMFTNGALFCVFNAPLLYLLIQERHFATVRKLYKEGVIPICRGLLGSSAGILPVSVMVVGCLLLGLLLLPIDRLIAVGWTLILNKVRRKSVYFSPWMFRLPEYVPLLRALIMHKPSKLHWEWELFQTNLAWHIVTNISVFALLTAIIIDAPSWLLTGAFILLVYLIFLVPALLRSEHMLRVHKYYSKRFSSVRTKSSSAKLNMENQ